MFKNITQMGLNRAQRRELKQERKLLKELRKLKREETIQEVEEYNSKSIVNSKPVVSITMLSLAFSLVVSTVDLSKGITIGTCVIALTLIAVFLEAFVESIFEVISEFIHLNFSIFYADKDRRRSYKQTKKVIKYAINNDRISDEQISLMIEGLVQNARHESRASKGRSINTSALFGEEDNSTQETLKELDNMNNAMDNIISSSNNSNNNSTQTKATQSKYNLVFNSTDISIMNGADEIEKVTYEEIQQATTQEEIASMPYSTIYGYVVREDKTIYIDMEQEIAIIK